MRERNNQPSRGFIELMLTIPLLFLITWGSAMLAMRLRESGKLEHATWNYSMSKAHKADDKSAVKNAQSIFARDRPSDLTISNDTPYMGMGLEAFHAAKSPLPTTFKVALLLYHTEQKKLCRQRRLDPRNIIAYLGATGLNSFDPSSGGSDGFDLTSPKGCDDSEPEFFKKAVETKIPGNDLKGKSLFKQAIQWEAMCSTKFKYPFLWAIGIPEVIYIVAGAEIRPATSLLCGDPTKAAPEIPGGSKIGDLLKEGKLKNFGPEVRDLAKNFSSGTNSADTSFFSKIADFGKDRFTKISQEKLQDYATAGGALKATAAAAGTRLPSLDPDQLLSGIETKIEETASDSIQKYVTDKIQQGVNRGERYVNDKVEKYTSPIEHFETEDNHDFIPTL